MFIDLLWSMNPHGLGVLRLRVKITDFNMTIFKNLSTFRATACLTAVAAALALNAQSRLAAWEMPPTNWSELVSVYLSVEATNQSSRIAPSYGARASVAQPQRRNGGLERAPIGAVRLRRSNNFDARAVGAQTEQTRVVANEQEDKVKIADVPALPESNVEQKDTQKNPNPDPNAQTPQVDENTRLLEERQQQEVAIQQREDVTAEDKSRALINDDEDAPDARVRLSDIDVTNADVAEHVSDSNSAPVAKPVIETPEDVKTVKRMYGHPLAEKAVRDMTDDLLNNLRAHNGAELYARWRTYNASIRSRTNSLQTGNELNNRCRLRWYEALYQDPLNSVNNVEAMSREWASSFMGKGSEIMDGVRLARVHMDVPSRSDRRSIPKIETPAKALEYLKAMLVEAASYHAKAVAPMSKNDIAAVMNEAYPIFCGQVESGHTIRSRGRGQYLIDAMEKINKGAMYDAGEAVLSLLDEIFLAQLAKIDFNSLEKTKIGDEQIVGLIPTEAGDILIGDSNRTVWDLDNYPKACCIIDLGGDDVYREGSCVLNRPLLVVIDFGKGNDEYVGKNYAIQAGAVLGVTMWYDDGGDDSYLAKDICQGSAIGGFAVLVNDEGNDKYMGFRRAQGAALCGIGLLIDRAGRDDYRAALIAQGFGAPGGFGALVDREGDDHYYVGGYFFDSYPEHPGYDGWGQGIGAGIRRCACGGIGLILDGSGDDAYECDYFGHGGGYWMGVGIARDFGGNDIRYGATSTMYDGSRRREKRWTRFVGGFGCHYAVGYLFDDQGNDVYGGTIMGLGMGWDLGAGFLVDLDGDDSFEATGGLTQGAGGEGSIGVIMNYRGNDTYYGNYQGYSNGQLSYHAQSNCGANFSFVIDHGGNDKYGGVDNYRRPIQNNAITVRGFSTGLIVDRPSPDEEKAAKGQQAPIQQAPIQQASGQGQRSTSGFQTQESNIKTMVAPPPLYDTNPHITSSGTNAFNPTIESGTPQGFGGGGLLRGLFGN